MFKEKRVLFLIAETPIHAGSGSEVGIVDLPIQRERYTDFPKIESSGLKGSIREAFEISSKKIKLNNSKEVNINDKLAISIIFGPEGEEAYAGAMTITDAKILLFPVKSLKGVFAWITCPLVLERFRKDLEIIGLDSFKSYNFSELINTIPNTSNIDISSKVILEEFTFQINKKEETKNIANWIADNILPQFDSQNDPYKFWREKMGKDIVILSDDDFRQFVKTSTEVITRTKINNITGTVESGALWTEEYLPQDTILYSLVMFTAPRVEEDNQKGIFKSDSPEKEAELICKFFEEGLPEVIQIGGNQTIGKGFVRTKLLKSNKEG